MQKSEWLQKKGIKLQTSEQTLERRKTNENLDF